VDTKGEKKHLLVVKKKGRCRIVSGGRRVGKIMKKSSQLPEGRGEHPRSFESGEKGHGGLCSKAVTAAGILLPLARHGGSSREKEKKNNKRAKQKVIPK